MGKLQSVLENFQKVKEAVQAEKKKVNTYDNSLIFKPQAVKNEEKTKFKLRFLPIPESTIGKPWIELKYHMFERDGDNKYIKVIDPRSFDKQAQNPIADLAAKLYATGNAVDAKKGSTLYSKKRWFTLVYIKEAPENQKAVEGKVMIFEAGKQIWEKLNSAIEDEQLCFWDPYKGRDFLLIMKQKGNEKWADYTESKFIGSDAPISSNEETMNEIGNSLETITIKKYVIDKDGVKSAKELKALLEGGLNKNESPAEEMVSGEKIEPNIDPKKEVDFGAVEEKPKAVTPKVEEKPKAETTKSSPKTEVEVGEFELPTFNDDDFKNI